MRDETYYSELLAVSNQFGKEEVYWLSTLSGELKRSVFPYDNPGAVHEKPRMEEITFSLPPEICSPLLAISGGSDYKIHMIYLAAVSVLLSKYGGDPDIIVGMPVYRQETGETDQNFINTLLAIRNEIPFPGSFREFLLRVNQTMTEAVDHVNYPIEVLIDKLGFTFQENYFPLFDVAVLMENIHHPDHTRSLPLNIVFSLSRTHQNLEAKIQFNANLYRESKIQGIVRHLTNLLGTVLGDVNRELSRIQVLAPEEREEILVHFNKTQLDFNVHKTIHETVEEHAAKHPGFTAVINGRDYLTYGELNRQANRLARFLRKKGIRPDTAAGIMLEKSLDTVIAILAVLKAGGAYLPLDPGYPLDRIHYMIKDSTVQTVITKSHLQKKLPLSVPHPVFLDLNREEIEAGNPGNLSRVNSPRDLAYIIYTSGSTGMPKGTMIEHRSAVNLGRWQAWAFQINSRSRILQFFSYNFDGAVGETMMALLNGAALVMVSLPQLESADLIQFICANRVNLAVLVPSMLKQLNPAQVNHPGPLTIVSVGEACPHDFAAKWSHKCRLVNGYGPTETTVYSHIWDVDMQTLPNYTTVPIGKPIGNYKSYILDKHLNPVPVGVPGEIYISGIGLARGYLNKAQITARHFIPNPFYLEDKYSEAGHINMETAARDIQAFKNQPPLPSAPRKYRKIRNQGQIPSTSILQLIRSLQPDLIQNTETFIHNYCREPIQFNGFCRYLFEGLENSYYSRGINIQLLSYLLSCDHFKNKKGVDFGFGNGEIIQVLEEAGCSMKGFDLSPFFVQHAREKGLDAQMLKLDTPRDIFARDCVVEPGSMDFGISTLVLDRIENPRQMLVNLFSLVKPRGRFAIQTLLPIVPVDDGQVDTPIVYTPPHNRITHGGDVQQDKLQLVDLLYRLGGGDIRVCSFPFVVLSDDGLQDYVAWSFSGIKTREPGDTEPLYQCYAKMYKTGDVGYYAPDGNIEFTGRVDHQVKLRGFRVELGEIENRLLSHPHVKEALVVAKKNQGDPGGDQYLCAYIVPPSTVSSSGQELDSDQLKAYLDRELPDYMVPSYFVILEQLPLTPNGKIDRKRLPEPVLEAGDRYTPPRDEVEKKLVEIWAGVLGAEYASIGIHTNFFNAGGHSLKATTLVSKIHKAFDTKIPLGHVFKYPTVSELAQLLRKAGKTDVFTSITPVETAEYYALSSAQKRLYILHRLEEKSVRYNSPIVVQLEGSLDLARMEDAFNQLIQRHESLRTSFEMIDGTPRQKIHPSVPFRVEAFSSQPHDETAIKNILSRFNRPFDIASAPLFRAGVIKTADTQHILMLDMNHIIADGVSFGVMVGDFMKFYNRRQLPPLPLQYKDFAAWQNRLIQTGALQKQEEYWLRRFQGQVPTLEMPTDFPRPEGAMPDDGASTGLVVEEKGTGQFNNLLKETQTTAFMMLLSVYFVLLSRYTGQEDIVVGSPVTGRRHDDVQDIVGIFINMLPFRCQPSGHKTFREFLLEVKEISLQAFENQEYQFEDLVMKLGLQGKDQRNPLFSAAFSVQNMDIPVIRIPGLTLSPYPFEDTTTKYDFRLAAAASDQFISLSMTYSTVLFKPQTMEQLMERYAEILEQVLENPGVKLADIKVSHDLMSTMSNTLQGYQGDIDF